MLLTQPRGDTVVEKHPVFAAHESVAATAWFQGLPIVGVDAVQELGGVGALNIDFSQGRCIEYADGVARRQAFTVHGVVHGLPGTRVVPGSFPLADVFELRAAFHMPCVHRRLSHRICQLADIPACQHTESDGCIGRSEGGRADGGHLHAELTPQNRQCVDIGGLALIGAHAGCRVAFEVLHRPIAFARREPDIGSRHIVLKVDEVLGQRRASRALRQYPHRLDGCFLLQLHARRNGASAFAESGLRGGYLSGLTALRKYVGKLEGAARRSGRTLRLERFAGHEAGLLRVVGEPAPGLREQVHGGIPAAGHAHEIASDGARRTIDAVAGGIERRHFHRRHPRATRRSQNRGSGQ